MRKKIFLGIVTASALLAAQSGAETLNAVPDAPAYTEAFGVSVRSYLLDHPEVVLEVFTILEREETAKKARADTDLIENYSAPLFASKDAVKGNPNGTVKAVEFFDYACGYCKAALSEVSNAVAERDQLGVVLKEFPILGKASEQASRLALAVRAVHGDEAYIGFHNALLSQKGNLNEAVFAILTEAAGYDYTVLAERGKAEDISKILEDNSKLALGLKINGTPAFVFETEVVRGMMQTDRIVSVVDRLSQKK